MKHRPTESSRQHMKNMWLRPAPSLRTILAREGVPAKRYLQGTTPALDHFFGNTGTIGMQLASFLAWPDWLFEQTRNARRRGVPVRCVLTEERRLRDGERRLPIDYDPAPAPGARYFDNAGIRVVDGSRQRPTLPPPTVDGVPIEPWTKRRRRNKPGAGGVRTRRLAALLDLQRHVDVLRSRGTL